VTEHGCGEGDALDAIVEQAVRDQAWRQRPFTWTLEEDGATPRAWTVEEVCRDPLAFARALEALEPHRRVAVDWFGRLRVSTVFLGTDMGHRTGALPLLWETLVETPDLVVAIYRWPTREAAAAGHSAACRTHEQDQ
jgi:hypothetical protein